MPRLRETIPSSRQHFNNFQTITEVAHTLESLRRFCGRFEPAKSISRSNTGATSGSKSALQFCRPVVPGIDFPARRPYIRTTTGGQKLVRGRIQRDDRTVPFQLCRGNRQLNLDFIRHIDFIKRIDFIRREVKVRYLVQQSIFLLNYYFILYRSYRTMVRCERHQRRLTRDRHGPSLTLSLRPISSYPWQKVRLLLRGEFL